MVVEKVTAVLVSPGPDRMIVTLDVVVEGVLGTVISKGASKASYLT